MATPTVAINKSRVLKKIMAILIYPLYGGSARAAEDPVGGANMKKVARRVWVSIGVPSGGVNVAAHDLCLDTTGNNIYRYYDGNWDRIDITT